MFLEPTDRPWPHKRLALPQFAPGKPQVPFRAALGPPACPFLVPAPNPGPQEVRGPDSQGTVLTLRSPRPGATWKQLVASVPQCLP